MDNGFIEVIGSQSKKPEEIDLTSSAFYVYERKDIQPYEEKDEQQNVTFKGWKYLERKVPREQWNLEATKTNKENIDAIMLGLIDLFELQSGVE